MAMAASHFRLASILLAAVLGTAPAAVEAATVRLDGASYQVKGQGTVRLKAIELTDTNLSEDEVKKLFSAATLAEADPLLMRLEASAVTIGEIAIEFPGQGYTLHDFRATGVKNGKLDRLAVGGLDGHADVQGGAAATVKAGTMLVEKGDFGPALSALTDHRPARRMEAARVSVSDIEVTAPDKDTPANAPGGNLFRIRLTSMEGSTMHEGSVEKSTAVLKGLTVEPPKASAAGRSLTLYGYDRVVMDATFSGRFDAKSRTYVLDDLTLGVAGIGSIKFEAAFGGIDPDAFAGDAESTMKALADGEFTHAAVRITDAGYFEKAIAVTAAQERKTPQQIRMQWIGAIEAMAMNPGGGAAMKKLNTAVAAFISDPKSLTISFDARTRPVKFREIGEIRTPDALMDLMEIDAKAGP
jgi:hypothetical protein